MQLINLDLKRSGTYSRARGHNCATPRRHCSPISLCKFAHGSHRRTESRHDAEYVSYVQVRQMFDDEGPIYQAPEISDALDAVQDELENIDATVGEIDQSHPVLWLKSTVLFMASVFSWIRR